MPEIGAWMTVLIVVAGGLILGFFLAYGNVFGNRRKFPMTRPPEETRATRPPQVGDPES